MIINDSKTISEIQEEFIEKFPFLRIDFYKNQHDVNEGSPKEEKIESYHKIGEIRRNIRTGNLSINGHLKVATLEERFEEDYGLNVQVFRRSDDVWLQTTATDNWTLTEQNERGKDSLRKLDLKF